LNERWYDIREKSKPLLQNKYRQRQAMVTVLINDTVKKYLLNQQVNLRKKIRNKFEFLETGIWEGRLRQDYVKVDVPLKRYGIYFISAESIRTQISIKIENWRPVRAKKQGEIYLLCFLTTKYGLKYYGEVNSLGYHRLLTLEKER